MFKLKIGCATLFNLRTNSLTVASVLSNRTIVTAYDGSGSLGGEMSTNNFDELQKERIAEMFERLRQPRQRSTPTPAKVVIAPEDDMSTKLVVGQKIWMQSWDVFKEATVIEITEEYIAAKPVCFEQNERPWMIHFQKDGKQFSIEDLAARLNSKWIDCGKYMGNLGVYDWCCGAWGRFDPRPLRGDGGGLWELTLRGDGRNPGTEVLKQ
jgi:hypothetical protein